MKKRLISLVLLCLCLIMLASCDPVYPPGELKVAEMQPLPQGSSAELEIIYPNTGGSIVEGWKDQSIEIIGGNDIVAVSGLTIAGLKPGTALLKVSATTVLTDDASKAGYEEKTYFTEIEIQVE